MGDSEDGKLEMVTAVGIKFPQIWPEDADVWFSHVESQFILRGVKDETTKWHFVVSALDHETARRHRAIIKKGPEGTVPYADLKKIICGTSTLSKCERALRLLEMKDLGDRTPSTFMDELLALMDGHTNCFLLEAIFLNALPEQISLHLEDADFSDPRAIAAKADALFKVQQASASVNSFVNEIPTAETQKEAVHTVVRPALTASGSSQESTASAWGPVIMSFDDTQFEFSSVPSDTLTAGEPTASTTPLTDSQNLITEIEKRIALKRKRDSDKAAQQKRRDNPEIREIMNRKQREKLRKKRMDPDFRRREKENRGRKKEVILDSEIFH